MAAIRRPRRLAARTTCYRRLCGRHSDSLGGDTTWRVQGAKHSFVWTKKAEECRKRHILGKLQARATTDGRRTGMSRFRSACLIIVVAVTGGGASVAHGAEPASAEPGGLRPLFTLNALDSGRVSIEGYTTGLADSKARSLAVPVVRPAPLAPEIQPVDQFEEVTGLRVASVAGGAALVDVSTISSGFMWAATPTSVDISWRGDPRALEYRVYRDDKALAKTKNSEFRDATVTPGRRYGYRVEARWPVTDDGSSIWDGQPPDGSVSSFGFAVHTPVNKSADALKLEARSFGGDMIAAAAPGSDHDTRTNLRAFIPYWSIGVPPGAGFGCGNYTRFLGDNRYFTNSSTASSRINEETLVDWGNHAIWHATKIQATWALYENGRLAEQRTAGPGNSGTWYWNFGTQQVTFKQVISAGNPFCVAGSIEAWQEITIWKSGSYSKRGWQRLMPNLEIYHTYYDGSVWRSHTIRQRALKSTLCLLGGLGCGESF